MNSDSVIGATGASGSTLVACLVPTAPSRRRFWPTIFRCFAKQTWPNKHMVLIDEKPYSLKLPSEVEHLVVAKGTSIGEKLNIGVEASNANHFHKWDDDDWYNPDFLETLVKPLLNRSQVISIVDRHLTFLVKEWKMYSMPFPTLGGGTICFDRKVWKQRKFKDLSLGEDQDFILNRNGMMRVTPNPLNYVLVRHGTNTWKTWSNGKTVEETARAVGTLLPEGPEKLFPPEYLNFYQTLRVGLFAARRSSPSKKTSISETRPAEHDSEQS